MHEHKCVQWVHWQFSDVLGHICGGFLSEHREGGLRVWTSVQRAPLQAQVSGICKVCGAAVPSGRQRVLFAHGTAGSAALERGHRQPWVAHHNKSLSGNKSVVFTFLIFLCSCSFIWMRPGQILLLSNQVSAFLHITCTHCRLLSD